MLPGIQVYNRKEDWSDAKLINYKRIMLLVNTLKPCYKKTEFLLEKHHQKGRYFHLQCSDF